MKRCALQNFDYALPIEIICSACDRFFDPLGVSNLFSSLNFHIILMYHLLMNQDTHQRSILKGSVNMGFLDVSCVTITKKLMVISLKRNREIGKKNTEKGLRFF